MSTERTPSGDWDQLKALVLDKLETLDEMKATLGEVANSLKLITPRLERNDRRLGRHHRRLQKLEAARTYVKTVWGVAIAVGGIFGWVVTQFVVPLIRGGGGR